MSTSNHPHPHLHPQLLALKSSLLTTLSTLQTHIATNRDTHTRNIQALTSTQENLFSQVRAAKAYAGGRQQFLHPTTSTTTTASDSASSLAERIYNGPLRKIATLIRNEAYAARRREEDTLAIVRALEWEVEALEGVKEVKEEKEEEEYGMEFGEGSNGTGQGYEYRYEEEEEDQNVYEYIHQGMIFSQGVAYIRDGEEYHAMYNFGTTGEDEDGQEEERKGNFQP
ncbi:hypothetical protein B9Z19DRAFT_1128071 [Tuber borchii]|uniref:Uncharacterized protein n=1 Tax=Tuber borchii TaxID=42251 RepID=A0A2T6ZQ67_TUBBO|nr:hypothetical protein B9Z19DRAFT_1128071 [Tuber borchii]